jgi:hypothetical protein
MHTCKLKESGHSEFSHHNVQLHSFTHWFRYTGFRPPPSATVPQLHGAPSIAALVPHARRAAMAGDFLMKRSERGTCTSPTCSDSTLTQT